MEPFLMSGPYQRSIAAYRDNRVSGAIEDADPHRLVALLLSGARERLNLAQAFMHNRDMAQKGRVIGETCSIIGHLSGSLDHEAGGDIATGLASLYDYMQVRLTEANLHNDPVPLNECMTLLGEIESAWNAIPSGQRHPATADTTP